MKRILIDGGYIEGGKYYYYLTDHLGNNRVVTDADGKDIQVSDYYAFGLPLAGNTGGEKQPYKYNNKELDGLHGVNLYDYSARYMDSGICRFLSVDPLAEKYYSISPYVYVANNPVRFIDPMGMSLTDYYTLRNCVYDKIGHYDDGTDNIVVAIQDEVIVEGKMPRNVENQIVGVAGTSGFTADVGKTGGLAIG